MTNLAWSHIKKINQINECGSKDELIDYIDANINDITGHTLSAVLTCIDLTPKFVHRYYSTLEKITKRREIFNDKELGFRDNIRLNVLDIMINDISKIKVD
ncbi:hypothetical protein ABT56_19185 [Photobacterium aquae]|uniref:Uncharacterized protein n=1 Tax=Photobacterium aquae TaxID=1195763 RepID=A0A0J1GUX9_9GAMM|nr:hypothetical protein [Photobacterium aquae]KLV03553.1 hypothetical protein ABT56_19185 [Photobacterium aquae]